MGKKDKLLKEAFLVYQSANTKHSESESSAMKDLPEYTEGFEDKIYRCIERMHITNPQEKAKKIKVAVFGLLILCCLGVFFFYKYKHKPVEATKQLEELFQEAYDWHYTHEDYIPERVYEEGSDLQYEVLSD